MVPTPWGERPRHFGDPADEARAALSGVALFDRSHRARVEVTGRAPGQMLLGVLTGSMPVPPARGDWSVNEATYSGVLTPKGRLVTDLRVFSTSPDAETLLLDVPRPGARGLADHLQRFIPPRLAKVTDVSAQTGMVTVVGPEASGALARVLRSDAADAARAVLDGMVELQWVAAGPLRVCRSGDVSPPAFDVIGAVEGVGSLWADLLSGGARPAGVPLWHTLRIEAGRPAFGVDMDQDTLLPEAGIQDRAIDHGKGCYTGQEVIVRIRDRGQVNRHLRGLLFGQAPTPGAGTQLFRAGEDRAVGRVTSATVSPSAGETIGLGYVRREVEPGETLRVDGPEGLPVEVRELGPRWSSGTELRST